MVNPTWCVVIRVVLCAWLSVPRPLLAEELPQAERVVHDIRGLMAQDLIFRQSDMKQSLRVKTYLNEYGFYKSMVTLVKASWQAFGGWPNAFAAALPHINYDAYRWRQEAFAGGQWSLCLQQLYADGIDVNMKSITADNSPKSKASIAKVVGEANALTAAQYFRYITRKQGRHIPIVDFPVWKGSWDPYLEISGLDPSVVRKKYPQMNREQFLALTDELIHQFYKGLNMERIKSDYSVVFRRIAKKVTGFEYSGLMYHVSRKRFYASWRDVLEERGFDWQEILIRRRMESGRILRAQSEWVENMERGGSLIGVVPVKPNDVAIHKESLRMFYENLNAVVLEIKDKEEAELAETVIDLLLQGEPGDLASLAKSASAIVEKPVRAVDIKRVQMQIHTRLLQSDGCPFSFD